MNKKLQKKFIKFLKLLQEFKKDPTFKKIIGTANQARYNDDMDWEEALLFAVKKRKLLLERIMNDWSMVY